MNKSSAQIQLSFRDELFTPQLSGSLFWPTENTLLVADLHLEKMSSFAKKGQLLPPYDTIATLNLLKGDIEATGADRVICLGDSFHRDEGTSTLDEGALVQLKTMTRNADWHWLAGNHDPGAHQLGGRCSSHMVFGDIIFSHEPNNEYAGQIAGHLHPSARVRINGRTTRRSCFVHDKRLMILPAFGVSTGSLNILSQPFSGLFIKEKLKIIMLGRERLYPVSRKHLV